LIDIIAYIIFNVMLNNVKCLTVIKTNAINVSTASALSIIPLKDFYDK